MLRFLTAGESHGKGLVVIIDGLPFGMKVDRQFVENELRRRRMGYGRSARMGHDIDSFEILSGLKNGMTTGSPVSIFIENESFDARSAEADREKRGAIRIPRPGHADLAGAMKFLTHDIAAISERASARETASRVAAGAFCKILLSHFGCVVLSHTVSVGRVTNSQIKRLAVERIRKIPARSPLRCADKRLEKMMVREIDSASKRGDSLGGSFQIVVCGAPPGLGSFSQWDTRADALLAHALVSIPAVKAVEVGNALLGAASCGSEFHDEISYDERSKRFVRKRNNAGGIEGGITNGEEIRVTGYLKPVSSIKRSLSSVSLETKKREKASSIRSDICPVVAASIVGESMVAFAAACLMLEKFGSDSIVEMTKNFRSYMKALRDL